jgi:hypothetical protein
LDGTLIGAHFWSQNSVLNRAVQAGQAASLKRDEGAAARQGDWLIELAVWKTIASGGHSEPVVPPPKLPEAIEAVTLWLVLRFFSAGCTAMTGVEAVSNGVSAFCEPVVRNAHLTWASSARCSVSSSAASPRRGHRAGLGSTI